MIPAHTDFFDAPTTRLPHLEQEERNTSGLLPVKVERGSTPPLLPSIETSPLTAQAIAQLERRLMQLGSLIHRYRMSSPLSTEHDHLVQMILSNGQVLPMVLERFLGVFQEVEVDGRAETIAKHLPARITPSFFIEYQRGAFALAQKMMETSVGPNHLYEQVRFACRNKLRTFLDMGVRDVLELGYIQLIELVSKTACEHALSTVHNPG